MPYKTKWFFLLLVMLGLCLGSGCSLLRGNSCGCPTMTKRRMH